MSYFAKRVPAPSFPLTSRAHLDANHMRTNLGSTNDWPDVQLHLPAHVSLALKLHSTGGLPAEELSTLAKIVQAKRGEFFYCPPTPRVGAIVAPTVVQKVVFVPKDELDLNSPKTPEPSLIVSAKSPAPASGESLLPKQEESFLGSVRKKIKEFVENYFSCGGDRTEVRKPLISARGPTALAF